MTYEQAENIAIACVRASELDSDTKNEVISALIIGFATIKVVSINAEE